MPKVIDAKSWQLTPSADGRRYSKYPDGDAPGAVPGAVTGLTLDSIAPTSVSLSWSAAVDATSYDILRGTATNGVANGDGVIIGNVATLTYDDATAFSSGQEYYWRVRGVNANGAGSYTSRIFATPSASTPSPGGDPADLYIVVDAEVNSMSDYTVSPYIAGVPLIYNGTVPTVSTEQARAGTKSIKHRLVRTTNSKRCETSTPSDQFEFFQTHWFGFSIYIPSDWSPNSTTGELIWQTHNTPDDWANSKQPIIACYINVPSNTYGIRGRYLTTPEAQNPGLSGPVSAFRWDSPYSITQHAGTWVDWIMEWKPDYRTNADGGSGVCRIWINDEQVVNYSGPCAYNENQGPYFIFGVYKWDWSSGTSLPSDISERVYYHDSLRISKPNVGSYALVDPKQDD